jgi:hypothetical protein
VGLPGRAQDGELDAAGAGEVCRPEGEMRSLYSP